MGNLAAAYSYNYSYSSSGGGIPAILWLIYIAFIVIYVIGAWKVFEKAGQAGWKVLIPIYNAIIELRIVGFSAWYVLLFLVPLVNIVFIVIVAYRLAKCFGYGVGMTILEFVFGIGVLIMGFGDAKYLGPDGHGGKPAKTV